MSMRFPAVLQKGLLRRSIPAVVLLAETKDTGDDGLDVRRVLFDRLNTGGIRLNPQELRNALHPGNFNALLISLARLQPFTEAWNIPPYIKGEEQEPPDNLLKNPLFASLADAELVLRFFALRDAIAHQGTGSLRLILDRFMAAHASLNQAELAAMETQFTECITRLINVFGDGAFRLKENGRLSRPLYDALMVSLSLNPEINIESRAPRIRGARDFALDDDGNYEILVGRGNTINSVRDRVRLAESILRAGE